MGSIHRIKGSKWWRMQWRDGRGKLRTKTLRNITDRKIANQLLAKVEHNAALEQAGYIDPADRFIQVEGRKPIEEQIKGWQDGLKASRLSAKYDVHEANLVRRVMHQAKVICLLDIRPGDIRRAIGRMPRERGKGDVGARQRNKALTACKMFCEQMRRDQKMRVNPLADLEPWDERADQRRQHVAYDEGIAEAVIDAAAASKEIVERLTGQQRSMLYRTAAGTGFRKRTLCGLTVADLHLKASTPFIRVTASNVKNKVARDQVISVDLCRWLASYTRSMKPKDRLFPFRLSDNTAAMMRHDLRSIGVEYEATPTSFRDFHSWRNTFGTDLGRTANIKVVQEMMGHSTPVLTARYMRPTLADYSGAVESLPKHGAQRRRKARPA